MVAAAVSASDAPSVVAARIDVTVMPVLASVVGRPDWAASNQRRAVVAFTAGLPPSAKRHPEQQRRNAERGDQQQGGHVRLPVTTGWCVSPSPFPIEVTL